MAKTFNIHGICVPSLHYMVDGQEKVEAILRDYIAEGAYFTINRSGQYGKTTVLEQVRQRIKDDYTVLCVSFASAENAYFSRDFAFVRGLLMDLAASSAGQPEWLRAVWERPAEHKYPFRDLRMRISEFCRLSEKPVVLMIDEIDRASGWDVMRSFLSVLREVHQRRSASGEPAFQSVMLCGVSDLKNIRRNMPLEAGGDLFSPFNIARDFNVDMSFSSNDIAGMLEEYEADHETGMDMGIVSEKVYAATLGYPYLVSALLKIMDETPLTFDADGVSQAVATLVKSPVALFDSVIKIIEADPGLKHLMGDMLTSKKKVAFNRQNPAIALGLECGILRDNNGDCAASSEIFEKLILDYLDSTDETKRSTGFSLA